MWCPQCNRSFDPTAELCPDCGTPLTAEPSSPPRAHWTVDLKGGVMKNWPLGPDGQPEPGALLTHRSSVDMADKLLVNMLDAYGVPAFMDHPLNGCFGKVVLGMSGEGSDIYVPESLLEDAKALMEDSQND